MRNFKALGLVLIAALALGAVTASVVSAEKNENEEVIDGTFEAKEYPAHIVGKDIETENQKPEFTSGLGNITCDETSYTGELKEASKTVTITPDYKKCMSGERPATVTMNGCAYEFHIGTDTLDGSYHGTADLECPPNNTVEVHVYPIGTEEPHEAGSLCTFTMHDSHEPEETPTNQDIPVTYTEDGPDSVIVENTVTPAPIDTEAHGACVFFGTTNPHATLHIDATVEAAGDNEIKIGTTPTPVE